MKRKSGLQWLNLIVLYFFLAFACKKTITETPLETAPLPPNATVQTDSIAPPPVEIVPEVPFPEIPVYNCNGPEYGDSVLYPQPVGLLQSYIISPVNNPGPGKYFSWPEGLSLNANTGAINITLSQTGQRYTVGFVKEGTQDTCLKSIIIAGASYTDGVYVLANGQKKASPYFNANPNITAICSGSGTPGGSGCQWDLNGLAKLSGVEIDNHTGVIDLEKTLKNSIFGLLPLNGTTVTTNITYKLNDGSNMASQTTAVKLIFYNKKSDIPQSVLDQITQKQNNIIDQLLILLSGNPKPPLIIITRYN